MNRTLLWISACIASAAVLSPAWAQTHSSTTSSKQPQTTTADQPAFAENDAFFIFYEDQPSGYFNQARWAYVNGHRALAASNLRKAAIQLRFEAYRTSDTNDREALRRCATTLERLAGDLNETREMQPPLVSLDHAFARAQRTLARHELAMARDQWSQKRTGRATQDLMAAAQNVNAGLAWAGYDLTPAEIDDVSNAFMLRTKIEAGQSVSKDEFNKTLADIDRQINRLADITTADEWGEEPTTVVMMPDRMEAIWVIETDEPTTELYRARQAILSRDFDSAARSLRRAAAFLDLQTEYATGETKEDLRTASQQFDRIVYDIDHQIYVSLNRLDHAFAQSEIALAEYYRDLAAEANRNNEVTFTGRYLRAAAAHLDRASAWTGHQMETAVGSAVYGTRILAGKLVEGGGWTVDEINKGFKALGDGIEAVEQWVTPESEHDSSARPTRMR